MRQWVLSVPKRLGWNLEREPKAVGAVLHIFLRVIEGHRRWTALGSSPRTRVWAVSFMRRFGFSLTDVAVRSQFQELNVCYLDSSGERFPRTKGPKLAVC